MRTRFILLILTLCVLKAVHAQQWTEEEMRQRLNLGLKLGFGTGSIYGKELKNPRPMLGFNAGLFWHGKDTLSRINWQTGLEARFRGSNFANGDSGNTAYTRIGLITVDVPLLMNIRLGAPKNGKYQALQLGLCPGYILKSIVYIGADRIPAQRDNYLKTWSKLPLKPVDLQVMGAWQVRGPVAGYQISARFGIMDLNNNFVLPGNVPKTGTGQRIATWNVDFAFLF